MIFSKKNIGRLFLFALIGLLPGVPSVNATPDLQVVAEKESLARELSSIYGTEELVHAGWLLRETSHDWERLGELEKAAACLRESARLALLLSELDLAEKDLRRSLLLDRRIKNFDGMALTLASLTELMEIRGDFSKAAVYLQRALTSSKKSGPNVRAAVLAAAGGLEFSNVNLIESKKQFNRALKLVEQTDAPLLEAKILINLGILKAIEGNEERALLLIDRARLIFRETGDTRGRMLVNNALGFVHVITDDKQRALDYYRAADRMIPAGIDFYEKAKISSGLAKVNHDYGRWRLAEEDLQQAYTYFKKAEHQNGQAMVLPDLIRLKYLRGDIDTAKKLLQNYSRLKHRLDSPYFQATYSNLSGQIDFYDKHYGQAAQNFKVALRIYQRLGLKLPEVQNYLGRIFEHKGDQKRAQEYFLEAAEINRQIKDPVGLAESLYHLARFDTEAGHLRRALEKSEESIRLTESVFSNVANRGMRQSYMAEVFDRYRHHIYLLMQLHKRHPDAGFEIRALQTAERSRARLMQERLKIADTPSLLDADQLLVKKERHLQEKLNAHSNELTAILSRSENQVAEIDELSLKIKKIGDELDQIRGELKTKSPLYNRVKNPPRIDVAAFQRELLDRDTSLLVFSLGTKESYLWMVDRNNTNVYVLPGRSDLEKKAENLLKLLSDREKRAAETIDRYQTRITRADSAFKAAARNLSTDLFEESADQLKKFRRLIIVPDGKMQYLPLGALPFPGAALKTGEPLLVTHEIIYQPSASTLKLIRLTAEQNQRSAQRVLVYADPVYVSDDPRVAGTAGNILQSASRWPTPLTHPRVLPAVYPRLPASLTEAKSIESTFGPERTDLFTSFAANRQNFLATDFSQYQIIHLAAHGYLDKNRPELSGLVFSTFDRQAHFRDGLIRLPDIYNLKINADLVVLSACEMGIGKDQEGEGLLSLTNGFLQAGARSVVASRWKVDDIAAQKLMNSFYRHLQQDDTNPAAALRRAQMELRQNPRFASPYYWASFTIQGDFQRIDIKQPAAGNYRYALHILLLIGLTGMIISVRVFHKKLWPKWSRKKTVG